MAAALKVSPERRPGRGQGKRAPAGPGEERGSRIDPTGPRNQRQRSEREAVEDAGVGGQGERGGKREKDDSIVIGRTKGTARK